MGVSARVFCAFVALQVVQIIALDLGPSINPFSVNKQFIVRIVQQLPPLDDVDSERLSTYRDAEGQDFTCIVPPLASLTDRDVPADGQVLYKRDETAEDHLKTISGDCIRQKEGWWIFEVCIGKHVRQYHTVRARVPKTLQTMICFTMHDFLCADERCARRRVHDGRVQ
jgi:hypothetical protein